LLQGEYVVNTWTTYAPPGVRFDDSTGPSPEALLWKGYVAYVMYDDDIAEDNQPTTYIELWKGFVDYVDDAHFSSPR